MAYSMTKRAKKKEKTLQPSKPTQHIIYYLASAIRQLVSLLELIYY